VTAEAVPRPTTLPKRPVVTDALCVAAVTVLSALPYLPRLGFYSDDWSLLAAFTFAPHSSLTELVLGGFSARPVQGLYLVVLFRLFGLHPLGYHLVNTAVIAASMALFYLLLVRLRFARTVSFAATLLLVMLPQLSTVRVWYSAFQVPLSMALMLVSLHAQLSYFRHGGARWLVLAVAAAALSVAAYEIFAPLIGGFAAVLLLQQWRRLRRAAAATRWRLAMSTTAVLGLLILAIVYKVAVSGRAGPVGDPTRYLLGLHQLVRLDYDWRTDSGLNIVATPRAHFWEPVAGWWAGAKALISGDAGLEVIAISLLIAALACWRLSASEHDRPRSGRRQLLLLGIAAFLLGNATFLIVPAVAFTSTGIDNRVQVAAAIGVAMVFASLLCIASRAVAGPRRRLGFAAVIALVVAVGFVRLSGIEGYWADAPALQKRVLGAARADLRGVPANSTIILDGVCPYFGPAVIFEAPWDVAGALTLALGRPVNGDAVSPRMSLTGNGLETSIYKVPGFYPYGPRLFVYNPVRHQLVRLVDSTAAVRYFRDREPRACPGFVARGVAV
jgi:hypothetical protein